MHCKQTHLSPVPQTNTQLLLPLPLRSTFLQSRYHQGEQAPTALAQSPAAPPQALAVSQPTSCPTHRQSPPNPNSPSPKSSPPRTAPRASPQPQSLPRPPACSALPAAAALSPRPRSPQPPSRRVRARSRKPDSGYRPRRAEGYLLQRRRRLDWPRCPRGRWGRRASGRRASGRPAPAALAPAAAPC